MIDEPVDDEPESGEPASASVDPFAAALSLSGASRERADAFLARQSRLIELQTEHLHEQREVQVSRLKLNRLDEWLKVALKLLTGLFGLALAAGLAAMMWDASQSSGLLIEPFSVPPDLVQRGLTGQVVATRLIADLASLQAQTNSARAPSSYLDNWGNDIKLEIPETGVSIGEFHRLLRSWLGHDTHISGAVYHTMAGIAVIVTSSDSSAPPFSGKDADFDTLLQEAAASVYGGTQPYRYAVHLASTGHDKEAAQVFEAIASEGPAHERAWGFTGLSGHYLGQADFAKAAQAAQQALDLRANFLPAYLALTDAQSLAEHDEAAINAGEAAVAIGQRHDTEISEQGWDVQKLNVQTSLAGYHGDYLDQIRLQSELLRLPQLAGSHENSRRSRMQAFAALHDPAGSDAEYAQLPPTENPRVDLLRQAYKAVIDVELGRTAAMLAQRQSLESRLSKLLPRPRPYKSLRLWPAEALALAQSGEFAAAHALIDQTPPDCVSCLRTRGRIDGLEKNWGGASYWFDRAARAAPSTPFPWSDWGQVLLAKGDLDDAIEKYRQAVRRGPHFADPLLLWGEALMAKNQSHLAVAKFAAASHYAPNWGRIYLKWGEALTYAGREQQAGAQIRHAAHLALSAAERQELAQFTVARR